METASYQVIARKYRPQTFASVVGQEVIVTTLKNALRSSRLAHAYLFCGCRGTGKTTLARVFAKALNCQKPTPDFEPCNSCPSCLDITLGRALDVLEVDGASNRGIDDIRQINETVGYAPAVGHYKIYIIDEVHMLTKEAFNALLKTLEEPPSHVKFFFATTEPHKIPPTILSRCQRFDLGRIPLETLQQKLLWITQDLNVACDEDVLFSIATIAEGSLRDAESLLDQVICYAEPPITLAKVSSTLGLMPTAAFLTLDQAFDKQNLSYAFELTAEVFSSGKDLGYFLDHLTEHYRTLLKFKLDQGLSFPSEKLKQQYGDSRSLYTQEQCVYILDFLIQTQQQIHKTPFKRVHLEMLLLHIIRSKQRLILPTLVKRLQELEKQFQTAAVSAPEPQKSVVECTQKQDKLELPPAPEPQKETAALFTPTQPETPSSPQDSSMDDFLIQKIQKKLDTLPMETPTPSFPILSKTAWEAKAAADELIEKKTEIVQPLDIKVSPPQETAPTVQKESSPQGCHYDTLIRFAAIELEGIIKNLTK